MRNPTPRPKMKNQSTKARARATRTRSAIRLSPPPLLSPSDGAADSGVVIESQSPPAGRVSSRLLNSAVSVDHTQNISVQTSELHLLTVRTSANTYVSYIQVSPDRMLCIIRLSVNMETESRKKHSESTALRRTDKHVRECIPSHLICIFTR
jgi:hypothetical protein